MKGAKSEVGDTRWSPNGYHYTRTEEGWTLTHRIIAAEKLGRPLAKNERVTFKDNNRKNYEDPDNLIVSLVRQGSDQKRIAQLEARRDEIEAELELLYARVGNGAN